MTVALKVVYLFLLWPFLKFPLLFSAVFSYKLPRCGIFFVLFCFWYLFIYLSCVEFEDLLEFVPWCLSAVLEYFHSVSLQILLMFLSLLFFWISIYINVRLFHHVPCLLHSFVYFPIVFLSMLQYRYSLWTHISFPLFYCVQKIFTPPSESLISQILFFLF